MNYARSAPGGSVLGDSVTSEYKINYLRPAIGDDGERTVAVAQGTINKVDPKK